MNSPRSQCHDSLFPHGLRHCSVMHSPPPSALAPQARGEASSRQPAVPVPDIPISIKSPEYSSRSSEDDRQNPLQNTLQEIAGSRSLRRRASQGSLETKSSAISRFISKKNVCLQIPDSGHLDVLSSDSSSRPQGDYFSTLPPTPPDDDEHVAWNPRSGMLYFEPHMNRSHASAPCSVDQGPSREAASGVPPDNMGSPGAVSNPSSTGGSQSSAGDAMDCDRDCDRDSWLDNGIEVVGRLSYPNC